MDDDEVFSQVQPELLAFWRKEYGNLYTCEIHHQSYIFRSLTLAEIDEISLDTSLIEVDLEDIYVNLCTLYPFDLNLDEDMRAGDVSKLAEYIMNVSGLSDPQTIQDFIDAEREDVASNLIMTMKTCILTAMPNCLEEDLDKLTIRQLIRKTMLAEQILNFRKQIQNDVAEIRFTIAQVTDDEDLEPLPSNRPSPPKKKTSQISDYSKEQLLAMIRKEDQISADASTLITSKVDANAEKDLDVEILDKMLNGSEDMNDPTFRKLHGLS